jgi:alpha-ketoglutarate-dependent taurine dioxygenase
MNRTAIRALWIGAVALVAAAGYATAAAAQPQSQQRAEQTPKSWSYDIKDGKRVPKGDRVTNSDGSWRETVRRGKCVTVKEKSPAGEYKETRQCDPS